MYAQSIKISVGRFYGNQENQQIDLIKGTVTNVGDRDGLLLFLEKAEGAIEVAQVSQWQDVKKMATKSEPFYEQMSVFDYLLRSKHWDGSYPIEGYRDLGCRENIARDKIWRMQMTNAQLLQELPDVTVIAQQGSIQSLTCQVEEEKIVIYPPHNGYMTGEKYYLFVTFIKQPTASLSMAFTIASAE